MGWKSVVLREKQEEQCQQTIVRRAWLNELLRDNNIPESVSWRERLMAVQSTWGRLRGALITVIIVLLMCLRFCVACHQKRRRDP